LIHRHAFGADDNATRAIDLRINKPDFRWVTLTEQKWATSREGRGLVPELEQHPDDYLVSKQRWGAFIGTSLDAYLRQRGATQVFVTGIATSAGVESTARSAFDYGYNVALVIDAMSDRDADAHRHCVEKIFPKLGETDTIDRVLKLLRGEGHHAAML
jgi:nicotinamidase-related amidase